jgi:hypothetical protein
VKMYFVYKSELDNLQSSVRRKKTYSELSIGSFSVVGTLLIEAFFSWPLSGAKCSLLVVGGISGLILGFVYRHMSQNEENDENKTLKDMTSGSRIIPHKDR